MYDMFLFAIITNIILYFLDYCWWFFQRKWEIHTRKRSKTYWYDL